MSFNLSYQLKWTWKLAAGRPAALASFFILELLAIILSLLFVLWSKRAVDLATQSPGSDLTKVLILVVTSILLALIIRAFSGWQNERLRLSLELKLQQQVIHAQMMSDWQGLKQWHSGDIQLRVHSDCREVATMVGNSAISFLLTAIKLIASFSFLWILDPMLALILLAITPFLTISKIYFRKMRRLNNQVKQSESDFGNILQENIRNRMLIRAMDLLRNRAHKLDLFHQLGYQLKQQQLTLSALTQGSMNMAANIGYLLAFTWGLQRLNTGQISFGTMTAFLQLVARIQTPFIALIGFVPSFIRFGTSLERVVALLTEKRERHTLPHRMQRLVAVGTDNLSFSYDNNTVINNLTINIGVGTPTAIIGASGKGKTTLLRLLLGLLQPTSGSAWVEDVHGRHPLTAAHRINFAYVPQGNSLFSGTVRDNMFINDDDDTEERIKKALSLACADFVYALPDGLDTFIGEAGYGLSEGQAQRIAIARAMLRECDILLLDEITSALDSDTSKLLTERLLNASENKICLFMTHDLQLARSCKQTIYIA